MSLPPTLLSSEFLQGIPAHWLAQVEKLAQSHSYSLGQTLFEEGTEQDQLHLIASGQVRLEMTVPGRGHVPLLSLGAGDLLGWSALVGDQVMTTAAIALEPVTTVGFSGVALRQLCDQHPELGYHLMRQVATTLSRRLIATRLQLLDLFQHDKRTFADR